MADQDKLLTNFFVGPKELFEDKTVTYHCISNKVEEESNTTETIDVSGEMEVLHKLEDTSECSCGTLKSKKKREKSKKMNQPRPNFFFAIQVKQQKIRDQAQTILNHVTGKDTRLASAVIKPSSFHITMGVVHLKSTEEIERAKNVLSEVSSGFHLDFVKRPVQLDFQGIRHFRGQVVFAKLKDEETVFERLKPVVDQLLRTAKSGGISVSGNKDWKPHLTLMKLSKNPKLFKKGVRKIDLALFEGFEEVDFGYEIVESIQLCSMNGPKDVDGYYAKVAEYRFDGQIEVKAPAPSNVLQNKLNALADTTCAVKRRIHSMVVPVTQKKPKADEEKSNVLKYVAAAGTVALAVVVLLRVLKGAK